MTRGNSGNEIWSAGFSPDGKLLAVGYHSGALKIIDAELQEEIHAFEGHLGWVGSIAFSPSGDLMATGSYEGVVKVWDTARWEVKYSFSEYSREVKTPFRALCINQQHPNSVGEIKSLCFSPDGKLLAGGLSYDDKSEKGIKIGIWDARRGTRTQEIVGAGDPTKQWSTLNALSFASNNRLGISCSAHVVLSQDWRTTTFTNEPLNVVFDAKTGRQLKAFVGEGRENLVAAFGPDGKSFACGAQGGLITVWDAETGNEMQKLARHGDSVDVLTFCERGKLLVSGGWDKTLRVWDIHSGEQIAWIPVSDRLVAIWADQAGPRLVIADGGGPSNIPNIDCLEIAGLPWQQLGGTARSAGASRVSRWWRRLRTGRDGGRQTP